MMNLKIMDKEEYLERILKDNSVLVLNKSIMFQFYYYFYECLENKNKNIKISIGEKQIDAKNTILFSFCTYKDILENVKYKKGSLFYEYLLFCLGELNMLEEAVIFYNIVDIVKEIITKSNLEISYDLEEDIEKIIFSTVDFKLNFEIKDITRILEQLLKSYIDKNRNKIFIIFYDSSLLPLKFEHFDFCYTFDISQEKNILDYNLLCAEEVKKMDINMLLEKLESLWPVEFKKEQIIVFIKRYYNYKKCHIDFIAYEEQEYLTYKLMSKIFNENIDIDIENCTIRDNIKSFLEQI